ncbi:MAG: acyl carrier protein [Bacillota bacterium]|jgi:acyl carrier protein
MENILEKVKVIMAEHLNIDPQTITLDTTFQELEADSLDVVEMVMTLEDEFDIEIPDEQIENIKDKDVRQIVDYIYGVLK